MSDPEAQLMNPRAVLFESPSETELGEGKAPPKSCAPQKVAAGMASVASTAKVVWEQPGAQRGTVGLLKLNQVDGVDCPSCAWPDPDHRSLFEFCENGAKALADETTKSLIPPEFFANFSVEEISGFSDYRINRLGRLGQPMHLAADSSHYRPVSWERAFEIVAGHLRQCSSFSPDQAAFYTSGRCSNEAAFLYSALVRQFGTNNFPDCSNLCHESSGTALSGTIGIGKGTVLLEDFERCELILVIGQNPGTNHPRMLSALEKAKKAGAKIISINPLAEAGLASFRNPQNFLNPLKAVPTALGSGTPLSDLHVPVQVGGDLAFLKGVAKCLLEWQDQGQNVLDLEFITNNTEGFDDLCEDLRASDWQALEAGSGVPREMMQAVARWLAGSQRIIACWAMGITQHVHSVPTICQIVNLILMRGSIGKPGGGLCPVRGHSNVQGDRTVGITHKPSGAFLDSLGREFGFEPPRQAGFGVVETIEAMNSGAIQVLFCMGGNFLSASPDTILTAKGMLNCKLTVGVTTKLNRSHLVTGQEALILPCLGRTDIDRQRSGPQFVTTENSMGQVQRSHGFLEPLSNDMRSEVSIVVGLAQALGLGARWQRFADNYDEIRAAIERVIPGFENFNQRVRQKGGFYLPNGPRHGKFTTSSGKARFSLAQLPEERHRPKGSDVLWLTTIRSHDQFNTTIYGYGDRYRGVSQSRRIVFVSSTDLIRLGLQAGDKVDICSVECDDGVERIVRDFTVVSYPIPIGCCAAYFPETNPLVPLSHRDPLSGCPASKKIAVQLRGR